MNTHLIQQEKTRNWNSDVRLLERPVICFQHSLVKVKMNKSMFKLSLNDLKTTTFNLYKNRTNCYA